MPKTSQKLRLLIADDDETVRNLLDYHARKRGFEPALAESGEEFMEIVTEDYDVVLLDLNMPPGNGFDCLKFLQSRLPDLPAVILSSADEIQDAVTAMKAGAVDYLTKPFDLDEVFMTLRQAVELFQLRQENRELREMVGSCGPVEGIIGEGEVTQKLVSQIERISGIEATVLLKGESGVGKGLVARSIHRSSPRKDGPFITVSCPALPRELLESELFGHEKGAFTGAHQKRIGKIEAAAGGTLFLDEIGDLPIDLQPKLLNVLQDREFQRVGGTTTFSTDVRVIAATNVNLEQQVKDKEFREDLYYRLNVIPLELPPLRSRIEDLKVLSQHFLNRIHSLRRLETSRLTFSNEALLSMQRYDWPGNIRQLENVLERASAFCEDGCVEVDDLPSEINGSTDAETTTGSDSHLNLANIPLRELELMALTQTIRAADGNKAEAARRLGITEKSVYNKLKRFGVI